MVVVMVVMAVMAAMVTLVVMAEVMTVVVSRILYSQLTFVSFQGLILVDWLSRRPSTLSDL